MCDETTVVSRLHYVDAHHVQSDGACLDRLDVREEAGQRIGSLDGVIVDVEAGRVRYFVVHSVSGRTPQWQVLPFLSARLDRGNRALHVDFDRALAAPFSKLDRDALQKFADDEKTATLF
jgi:PRC-barrel domain protein